MNSKLTNPLVVAVVTIALASALGVALSWKAVTAAVAQAALSQPRESAEVKRKGWGFWTIQIENLSSELKDERKRLQQQADVLEQRAARLQAEEAELAKRRTEIDALERKINDHVIDIKADEGKNLRSLAATYSSLSPKAAVAIMGELDDATAVKILSLMKSDVVGPIFEEMTKPDTGGESQSRRAALLSEKLRLMKSTKATS